MGKIIKGYWTCEYCGKKNIGGDVESCPGCGRTRGANITFYTTPLEVTDEELGFDERPEEGIHYVTDEEELAHAASGPDWHCSYCDSYNPHEVEICQNCGHARDEEDEDYYQVHKPKPKEEYVTDTASVKSSSGASRFILLAAVIALFAVIFFATRPRQYTIHVENVGWTRSIGIEQLRTVQESDWSMPAGATLDHTQREVHHYNRILDHYETVIRTRPVVIGSHEEVVGYNDLGNGYFEEVTQTVYEYGTETYTVEEPVYTSVPVYADRYYYYVDRWQYDHTETVGAEDKNPKWPDLNLRSDQRESGRSENYTIYGTYKKKSRRFTMTYDDWVNIEIGQTLKIKVESGSDQAVILKD